MLNETNEMSIIADVEKYGVAGLKSKLTNTLKYLEDLEQVDLELNKAKKHLQELTEKRATNLKRLTGVIIPKTETIVEKVVEETKGIEVPESNFQDQLSKSKFYNTKTPEEILELKEKNGYQSWTKAPKDFICESVMPIMREMSNSSCLGFTTLLKDKRFKGLPSNHLFKLFGGYNNMLLYMGIEREDYITQRLCFLKKGRGLETKGIQETVEEKKDLTIVTLTKPVEPKNKVSNSNKAIGTGTGIGIGIGTGTGNGKQKRANNWDAETMLTLSEITKKAKKVKIAGGKFEVYSCFVISEEKARRITRPFKNANRKNSWSKLLKPTEVLSLLVYYIDQMGTYSMNKYRSDFNTLLVTLPSDFFIRTKFESWSNVLELIGLKELAPERNKKSAKKVVANKKLEANKNEENIELVKKVEVKTNTLTNQFNPNNAKASLFLDYLENGLALLTDLNDEESYKTNYKEMNREANLLYPSLAVIEENYGDFETAVNVYYKRKFKQFELTGTNGLRLVEEFNKLGKPKTKEQFTKAFYSNGNSKSFVPLIVLIDLFGDYSFYVNFVTM